MERDGDSMTTRVLSIMLDDAGFDFGYCGHPTVITPVADALAAAGRVFDRFRNNSSTCSPSRTSYITGQPAEYHGIEHPDQPDDGGRQWLPSGATTIDRCLKSLDPAPHTVHVGKCHLGTPGEGRNTLPMTGFGVDRFFGSPGGYPNSAHPDFARYVDAWVIDQTVHIQTTGYLTDVEAAWICDWLDAHGTDANGWLIKWWVNIPHVPLDNTIPQMALYPGEGAEARTYYASMSHFDAALGTVLAKLDALGIRATTHIHLTSDNGPPAGPGYKAGLRGGKNSVYDAGIRVPCFWVGPGISPGVDSENRYAIDWFPTVAGLFGFDAPAWPGVSMFDAAPQRDMGIHNGNVNALIRSTLGDGRTVKLVRLANDTQLFYCIDAPGGELDINALVEVPSGATAGQIDAADAASISAALDAYIADYPDIDVISFPDYPTSSEDAVRARVELDLSQAPRPQDHRVHMCGTTGGALQGALESLANHPYVVTCDHGSGGLTESALGALPAGTHPFGASLVVSAFLWAMCYDSAALANCTPEEREEIRARLATSGGDRVL